MSSDPYAAAWEGIGNGVFIGKVENVVDEDRIGQVQISLPWYASGYAEWARVAQLYAGKGYGSTWIPEVGCEVLVTFAKGGDMSEPYVIGCLHSRTDPPPVSRTKSVDVKTLRTAAGSELRFDEGEGVIDLKTAGGASIRLEEKAGAITLTSKQTISLTAPKVSIGDKSAEVVITGKSVAIN